jgi:hypothetical protein
LNGLMLSYTVEGADTIDSAEVTEVTEVLKVPKCRSAPISKAVKHLSLFPIFSFIFESYASCRPRIVHFG